ncbi:MAG: response regulator transcription factor, partial [Chloroflexi bacterium]|nr:response regulator transcription factor [Chloroflexota bacterium]
TMHDNEEYIRRALASGAMGYILKDAASRELLNAIRAVHRGEAVLSPAITRLVIEDYLRWGDLKIEEPDDNLSEREREILQLIAEGNTNKQIADILCISIKTVQAHRSSLMNKLDLHDRGELIKYAIQKKIIEI